MKYIVRPMYIREALVYGRLKKRRLVRGYSDKQKKDLERLGDMLSGESAFFEDYDFPHLPSFKCLVTSFDSSEDYTNFKDLDDAKSFVLNNEADWQEGGYYNAAHLLALDDEKKVLEEMFYSAARGAFVEMSKKADIYYLTKNRKKLMAQKHFDSQKLLYHIKEVEKYSFCEADNR